MASKYAKLHRDELPAAQQAQFDRDAQYLAELAAQGQWQPAMPVGDYTYGQVHRKAETFHRQQAAGLPVWNQGSRGHAVQEHHKPPTPPVETTRYIDITQRPTRPLTPAPGTIRPPAPPQRNIPLLPPPAQRSDLDTVAAKTRRFRQTDIDVTATHVQLRTEDIGRMQRIIKRVDRVSGDLIVFPSWKDADGYWWSKYQHGIKVSTLMKLIKEAGSYKKLVEQWEADKDSSPYYSEEADNGIPEYALTVRPAYEEHRHKERHRTPAQEREHGQRQREHRREEVAQSQMFS